jgi:hypothetical protein
MSRKPRVDRSPEEKWQIIQEGLKSGNVSETCGRHALLRICFIARRMKRNRAKAALGEKRSRGGNREGQSHPSVRTNAGAEVAGNRNPKHVAGSELWCGSLPGTRDRDAGLHGHAVGREIVHQLVEFYYRR